MKKTTTYNATAFFLQLLSLRLLEFKTRVTLADEAALEEFKSRDIDMGDTALGQRVAIRKRELLASVRKMTAEERSALRRKLDETDLEEAAALEPV